MSIPERMSERTSAELVEDGQWLDGERRIRLMDSDVIDMALAQAERLDKLEYVDRRVVVDGHPEDCRYRIRLDGPADELMLGIEYPLKVRGGLTTTFREFRVRPGRPDELSYESDIVLVSSKQFAAVRAVADSADTRPRTAIR